MGCEGRIELKLGHDVSVGLLPYPYCIRVKGLHSIPESELYLLVSRRVLKDKILAAVEMKGECKQT